MIAGMNDLGPVLPGGLDIDPAQPQGVAKQPLGGPEAVLDYLGRYTHRVAISNERIVGIEGNDVRFRVRGDPESGSFVCRGVILREPGRSAYLPSPRGPP